MYPAAIGLNMAGSPAVIPAVVATIPTAWSPIGVADKAEQATCVFGVSIAKALAAPEKVTSGVALFLVLKK